MNKPVDPKPPSVRTDIILIMTIFDREFQVMDGNKQFQASFIVQQYVEIFSRDSSSQAGFLIVFIFVRPKNINSLKIPS